MTLVQTENLSFRYGNIPVLDRVGFGLEEGDFAALIGSNGAGKSTLLRLLLGELEPSEGTVRLFGEDVRHFREWPLIGYVPQNGAATAGDFPATAQEVVAANLYSRIGPLRFAGRRGREAAHRALAQVGMEEYSGRLIGRLSGGQLQRVLIARVLAGGCKLLLLDEPVSGVDAESVEALYGLLAGLNRQGITILMVTHDMERCVDYVGRAFCLEHGSMVELDQAQMLHELHHRHRHPSRKEGEQ